VFRVLGALEKDPGKYFSEVKVVKACLIMKKTVT